MTLPVFIGPNRCELIYNHEKQPLLELSLRVCLPVRELLSTLSQLAPPAKTQASKMQRPAAKAPTGDTKRKDLGVPSKGQSPVRQSHLPQGSSSSDWRPSFNPWEQQLQPYWEPYPVVDGEWQGEWASSNPQVEEQAQLLWALSDQPVPKHNKTPLAQPKPPVPVKKRAEREVRFASPPEEGQGPSCPSTVDEVRSPQHRKETKEERDGSADEHVPPPRPGAHLGLVEAQGLSFLFLGRSLRFSDSPWWQPSPVNK